MQPRDSKGKHRRQTRLVGRNDETAKVPAKGEAGFGAISTWQPCRQTRSACGTPGGQSVHWTRPAEESRLETRELGLLARWYLDGGG